MYIYIYIHVIYSDRYMYYLYKYSSIWPNISIHMYVYMYIYIVVLPFARCQPRLGCGLGTGHMSHRTICLHVLDGIFTHMFKGNRRLAFFQDKGNIWSLMVHALWSTDSSTECS